MQVLLQWLQAIRLVHSIASELQGEQKQENGRPESAAAKTVQDAYRLKHRQRRGSASADPALKNRRSSNTKAAPKTPSANGGLAESNKTDRAKARKRSVVSQSAAIPTSPGGAIPVSPPGGESNNVTARVEAEVGNQKSAVTKPAVAPAAHGGSLKPIAGAPTKFSSLGSSHDALSSSNTRRPPIATAGKQHAEERERLAQDQSALRAVESKIDTGRHR